MSALKYVGDGRYVPGYSIGAEPIEVSDEEAASLIATGLYAAEGDAPAVAEPEPQGMPVDEGGFVIPPEAEAPATEPELTQEDQPDGE